MAAYSLRITSGRLASALEPAYIEPYVMDMKVREALTELELGALLLLLWRHPSVDAGPCRSSKTRRRLLPPIVATSSEAEATQPAPGR